MSAAALIDYCFYIQNIDFYLEMIKARNNTEGTPYRKVFIFHCFFYKLLEKRGYEEVQGATENVSD
jgi:Ulp1 family protease